MNVLEESAVTFQIRIDSNGLLDIICPRCYQTITQATQAGIEQAEISHVCAYAPSQHPI